MDWIRFGALLIAMALCLSPGAGCAPSAGTTDGNSAPDLSSLTGKPPTLPITLYSITPAKGSVDGGTAVSLQGPGLTARTAVSFGGASATSVQLAGDGTLTAVTPPHAQGTVDVAVTNDQGGQQQVTNGFVYSAAVSARPPQVDVTSIAPVAGPPEGGTYVTIRGTGFEAGMAVLFDNSAALSVNVVNDRLITAMTPPHPEGQVSVMVETPKHASFLLVNGFEYSSGLPAKDGTDTDGDGLTDYQETAGWEIWIDPFGLGLGSDTFGNVTRYVVTSDPQKADTDGDGLSDYTEYLIGSDPRVVDTDGDGLSDGEERLRWKTNPLTVDTDADSRGPDGNLAPNDLLFDGEELYSVADLAKPSNQRTLKLNATSPTLADTDGDGYTDFEELGSTVRSPVIADLPQVKFEIVDKVDVRLHVEYADSTGTEQTYGTELSAATTQTNGQTDIASTTASWEIGGEVGWEGEGPVVKVGGSYGQEQTTGTELTTETARECASALSQSLTDSQERSVTRSSGSISLGLRAVNTGNIVYTLNNLNMTVQQFKPIEGTYRAITSLVPQQGADTFVLSPGDSTPVIPLSDNTLDAGLITQFLANPSTLLLEPTSFGLLNKDGTNFAFQAQDTLGRTALVVIDYGGGLVEKHRVATNVNRSTDSSLAGITLGQVLTQLGLDYATAVNNDGGPANGLRRLTRIGSYSESAFGTTAPSLGDPTYPSGKGPGSRIFRKFWIPVYARGNPALPPINPNVNIDQFVLQARDEVRLVYVSDQDRDGLNDRQEATLGSSDNDTDSDNDGLSDWYEAQVGWTVTVQGQGAPPAYQVFPNPLLADADGDGLNDLQEQNLGTDPNNADTDEDGLPDKTDPFPLSKAQILYVDASHVAGAHDGTSWATAYTKIDTALTVASVLNSDADPSNDVRQIWVAQGNYDAPFGGVNLLSNVSIFGGFKGTETLRSQRNPDPFTNETHLRALGTGGRTLQAYVISGARFDGFILENGRNTSNPGINCYQATGLILANLLFQNHYAAANDASAGVGIIDTSSVVLDHCTFSSNKSDTRTGGLRMLNSTVQFTDCSFQANVGTVPITSSSGGGGAVTAIDCASVSFENCTFRLNQMVCPSVSNNTYLRHGGALDLVRVTQSRLVNCLFQDNQLTITGANDQASGDNRAGGAIAVEESGSCTLVGCVLFRNLAPKAGGGLYVRSANLSSGPRVRAVNCTIARNQAVLYGTSTYSLGAGVFVDYAVASDTELINCIVWGNAVGDPASQNIEGEQVNSKDGIPSIVANTSCIQNLGVTVTGGTPSVSGLGNMGQNPLFRNLTGGDFRLSANSPCIDAGNTLVDTDLSQQGTQPLPTTDIRGNTRIVDGDGNGIADVDVGAYEYQGG